MISLPSKPIKKIVITKEKMISTLATIVSRSSGIFQLSLVIKLLIIPRKGEVRICMKNERNSRVITRGIKTIKPVIKYFFIMLFL